MSAIKSVLHQHVEGDLKIKKRCSFFAFISTQQKVSFTEATILFSSVSTATPNRQTSASPPCYGTSWTFWTLTANRFKAHSVLLLWCQYQFSQWTFSQYFIQYLAFIRHEKRQHNIIHKMSKLQIALLFYI